MLSLADDARGQCGAQDHRHETSPRTRASATTGRGGGEGLPGRSVHGVAGACPDCPPAQWHRDSGGGTAAEAAPSSVVIGARVAPPVPPALLQNPHQICYINSCAHALNWVGLMAGAPRNCGGKAALLVGWPNITRQNDAGMFMTHLLEYATPTALHGSWQARLINPDVVADEGPLRVPITIDLQGATLQGIVSRWRLQHTIHGLWNPKGVVMLQLKRYVYRGTRAIKLQQCLPIEPCMLTQMPLFSDAQGLQLVRRSFRVVFVVHHIGAWVDQGHYQTALSRLLEPSQPDSSAAAVWEFHICNDGCKPRRARDRDYQLINTNY